MDREIIRVLNRWKESLAKMGGRVSRFVIFGSAATGAQRKYSDVDVVVISDDFTGLNIVERCKLTGPSRSRAGITTSMDVISLTEREYDELGEGTFIGDEVKPKGVIVA
jgi:predicted nucleotidyltransferase